MCTGDELSHLLGCVIHRILIVVQPHHVHSIHYGWIGIKFADVGAEQTLYTILSVGLQPFTGRQCILTDEDSTTEHTVHWVTERLPLEQWLVEPSYLKPIREWEHDTLVTGVINPVLISKVKAPCLHP